jgi:hypothetical protein
METRAGELNRDSGEDGGGGGGAGQGEIAAAVSLSGVGTQGGGHFSSLPRDGPPEHLSPGYGAAYDAGFVAGLIAASRRRLG